MLSTTLFNGYTNDLPQQLETSEVRTALYADDLVIWDSEKQKNSHNLEETVTKALEILEKWCDTNLMTVNTDKTKYQLFTLLRNVVRRRGAQIKNGLYCHPLATFSGPQMP